MRFYLLVFLIIACPIILSAQYRLVWDDHLSSTAGAENVYTVNHGLHYVVDQIFPYKMKRERGFFRKAGAISYRLAKTALVDAHIDLSLFLFQHEYFGHGYQYRTSDLRNNAFEIFPYPPYGTGGGYAMPGRADYPRKFGVHEDISRRAGGMEAAAVLSQSIKNKWLQNNQITYQDWLLYTAGLLDQTHYIYYAKRAENHSSGNDVSNYVRELNAAYGYTNPQEYGLTFRDLEKRSLLNLVNTYQLLAVYTFLKTYLWEGDEALSLPMINVGKYRWLPAVRFGLTPFGTEFYVDNDIRVGEERYSLYARIGDGKLATFWGGGLDYYRPWNEYLQLRVQMDFWHQPSLQLGGAVLYNTSSGLGGRALIAADYLPWRKLPVGIYTQIGYKTSGHLPGEQLAKGLVLRLGLSYAVR